MAKVDYDKFLRRLQARRADSPHMKAFQMQQASTALTQQSIDQQMRARLSTGGASVGAIEQAHQSLQQSATASNQSAWGQASAQEASRRDEIDNRIDGLEMAKDQQHQAERDAKKAKRGGLLKTVASFGGAALGGIAGLAIGGPGGAMLGAQIGGGIGGMSGSFLGGDGKMSLNNYSPEEFMTGFQDTAMSVAGALTLKSQKAQMTGLVDAMKGKTLTPEQIMMIRGFIATGDIESATRYLNEMGAVAPQPDGQNYNINYSSGRPYYG